MILLIRPVIIPITNIVIIIIKPKSNENINTDSQVGENMYFGFGIFAVSIMIFLKIRL